MINNYQVFFIPSRLLPGVGFVCDDALRPSQQFLVHVGIISCLPGLSHY